MTTSPLVINELHHMKFSNSKISNQSILPQQTYHHQYIVNHPIAHHSWLPSCNPFTWKNKWFPKEIVRFPVFLNISCFLWYKTWNHALKQISSFVNIPSFYTTFQVFESVKLEIFWKKIEVLLKSIIHQNTHKLMH